MTFFFGTVFAVVWLAAAQASTLGRASASTLRTTVVDLRISEVSLRQSETFAMDVTAGHPRLTHVLFENGGHGRRPTEKDVSLFDVANELLQVCGREQLGS